MSSNTPSRSDSTRVLITDDNESIIRVRHQHNFSHIPLHWIMSGILLVTALCFNLYRLGTPSIWYDEAFSVELARQPLPLLWHIIFGPEPNMELYYLFLHYWLNITSLLGMHATEFVVRFPSAIFAAFSTLVVFAIGRRFLGTCSGILGAVLYLLNAVQLTYAQQTRSYALQLLLICIAWYAFFTILDSAEPARRWWIIYVLAWVLAIYTHLFSLLILLSQLIATGGILLLPHAKPHARFSPVGSASTPPAGVGNSIEFALRSVRGYDKTNTPWRDRAYQQFVSLLVSLCTIFLLIIPMLIESLHGAKTGWLSVPHWHDIYHLFDTISGYNEPYFYAFIAFGGLGLLATVIGYFAHFSSSQLAMSIIGNFNEVFTAYQRFLHVIWSLCCWLVIPIGVSYLLSHESLQLFSSRYLVTIVPPLFLLVAFGVMSMRVRVVQGYFAMVLVVLALLSVPLYYKSAQVEDWNSTVHWLLQHYQPGDGLICYDNELTQGCQISVAYYLDAYPQGAHFTDDSPGAFSWQQYGPVNSRVGYNAALDPKALKTYVKNHKSFFYIVGRIPSDNALVRVQATEHWLDGHYHVVDQIATRTVTIRLYATH